MSTFLTSPPFSTTELSICLQNSLWASSLGKLQVTKVLPLSLCCTQFCPENFFIYQDLIINLIQKITILKTKLVTPNMVNKLYYSKSLIEIAPISKATHIKAPIVKLLQVNY